EVPVPRPDYAALARVIAADARQSLALERQPTASAAASAAPQSVNELYLTAVNDLENARFPRAVTLLKRVVEIQPTDRAAWSSLGRAYMGLRQTDAAIEAFLILIAIDASDPKPYG